MPQPPDQSAQALVARLGQNPGDRDAYDALRAHYRAAQDYASLANLIAGWAGFTQVPAEKSDAYLELAEVMWTSLAQPERAIEYYQAALVQDPLNIRASEGLQSLWEAQEQFSELATFLQQRVRDLTQAGSPRASIAVLHYHLGELWNRRLNDPDKAIAQYLKALELDATMVGAAYEARALCESTGDLQTEAELYECELVAEPDADRRRALISAMVRLHRENLEGLDGAIDAVSRCREALEGDPEPAFELATLLSERARAGGVTGDVDSARAANCYYEVAASASGEKRIEYLNAALAQDPTHERSISTLERHLQDAGRQAELCAAWVSYLALGATGAEADRRRISLANAYLKSGQRDDALFCLEPAVAAGNREASALWEELSAQHEPAPPTTPPPARSAARRGRATAGHVSTPREPQPRAPEAHNHATAAAPHAGSTAPPKSPPNVREHDGKRDSSPTPERPRSGRKRDGGPAPEPPKRASDGDSDSGAGLTPVKSPPAARPSTSQQGGLAQLRERIGELVAANRKAEAIALYLDVLELAPTDRDAFNFLDSHYRRVGDHRARCDLMLQTGNCQELVVEARVLRLREAASLLEKRLKNADSAVRVWKQIAKLDPKSDEPRRNLKRLLEQAKRWDELVANLESDVDNAKSTDARIQVLKRLIGLHREQRGDHNSAADAMARIVALNPRDRGLTNQLIDTLLALGRYQEAVPLLERQIADAPSKSQRLARLRMLANVLDEKLSDTDAAVATYERIVELVPADAAALARMIALDEAGGNHERLLQSLERRRKVVPDSDAAELCVRMGNLAEERLDDLELAADYMEQALELAPGSQAVLDSVCSLYDRTQRYEDLVETLREQTLATKSRDIRVALHRRIARTLADKMHDNVTATEAYNALLDLREDPEALRFLEGRARGERNFEELSLLLKRLSKIESGDAARDLACENASILLKELDRPRDATTELVRLVDQHGAEFTRGIALLEQACAKLDQYGPLARALERQLSAADGQPLVELAKRLCQLYSGTMGDHRRALHVLGIWTAHAPRDPEPHRRARQLLDARRTPDDLLSTLDALSKLEDTAGAQAAAAIDAARHCAGAKGDLDGAWERLLPLVKSGHVDALNALSEIAIDLDSATALCGLLESLEQYERLEAVVTHAIDVANDDDGRVDWLHKLARLRLDHLENRDGAETAYTQLLRVREDAPALRFREARARERDDPELLADCLERLAALETDADLKRDLLFDLGQLLLAKLKRPAEATQVFQQLVNHVASDFEPALDGLVDAADAANDHPTLASALAKQMQRAQGRAERATIARRLTFLFEGPLANRKRAIAALRQWRKADPNDVEPLQRLRVHLDSEDGSPTELLEILDALGAQEETRSAQLEAIVAAAVVARDGLASPQDAWERIRDLVAEADPDVDAILRSLADDQARFDELCEKLEAAGRFGELVDRLEQRAGESHDPLARAGLHRRAARLLAQTLDDAPRAAEHYAQLLSLEEDAEALRFLQTRAMASSDAAALADCLRRLAAIETNRDEQRDLLFEYAHILQARLGQPQEAIVVLRKLLAEHQDFDAALDELSEASEAAKDYAGLAESLERMLVREPDKEMQVDIARRLCAIYCVELNTPRASLNCLRRWVQASSADPEPLRRLRPLLNDEGDRHELLNVLDALALYETTPEATAEAALEAGLLCADELQDDAGAWTRLLPLMEPGAKTAEHKLHEVAQRTGRLADLCALYEQAERYDELISLLRERAEQSAGSERVELYRHCARTLRDRLDDELGAAEVWRELLAVRDDGEALRALCQVARRQDDTGQLDEMLRRLATEAESADEKRDVGFERALLLSDQLGRPAEAVELLRHIVGELDPDFDDAVEKLIAVCEQERHFEGLAEGLSRRLAMRKDGPTRADLARKLSELYEEELDNDVAFEKALVTWAEADQADPIPLRRLRPIHEARDETEELLVVLDRLGTVEISPAERRAAVRSAAELCAQSGDGEAALARLAPLILRADPKAEKLASELADSSRLQKSLAGLYTRRAQSERDPTAAADDWEHASLLFERCGAVTEALEAGLRRLAADMGNEACLDRVDRLAVQAKAWQRLEQVYKRLYRDAGPEDRVRLALRQAAVLEREEENPQGALVWALNACRAMPNHEPAFKEAERLASLVGSHSDLLWLQEQRAQGAGDVAGQIAYLLSAARTADLGMNDREQANQLLSQALVLTEESPEAAPQLQELVRDLDQRRPELGEQDARRALVRSHLELARERRDGFGRALLLRAAQMVQNELSDPHWAYDILRQGSQDFSGDPAIIEALVTAAIDVKRLDGLDAHLARLARSQTDRDVCISLLRTRAELLAQHLQRFDTAARVYEELLEIDAGDAHAAAELVTCLRSGGRFQELLRLYDRQLQNANMVEERISLLRAQAEVWEADLRNRAQAALVWASIRDLAPGDPDANEALARLGSRNRSSAPPPPERPEPS